MTGDWWQYLLTFVASAGLCWFLTPIAMRVAVRTGVMDLPGGHKGHGSPVPYLGGVAIVVAFAGSVTAAAAIRPPHSGLDELVVVLVVAVGLAVVGLLDDLRDLSPLVRLVLEVAAGLVVWQVDAGVRLTGVDWLDAVVTVFWVVGVTNAFNLLDNMDGLAAGLAGLACGGYFVIAVTNGQYLVAGLSVGLAGCALGFLRHNFHPARIYMGDGGALFLGFLVAYLGIKLRFDGSRSVTFLVPVIVCSVAILDTTLVTISRLATGRSPFEGGRDHVSHRLVKLGLPVRVAVASTYFAAASIGVLALVVSRVDLVSAWIVAGLVGLTLLLGGILLWRVPVYPESQGRHFAITEQSEDGQSEDPSEGSVGG